MIQDFVKDHKILPPVLFINLDNCGRENKVFLLTNDFLNMFSPPESVFAGLLECFSGARRVS